MRKKLILECKPGEIHLSIRELVAAIIWNNEASLKVIAGMMDKLQWESGRTPRLSFLGHHLLPSQGNVFSCPVLGK